MNFSNTSCEYFYDEEYDIALSEGTYNQPFVTSFNNNYYQCLNSESQEYEDDHDLIWSECFNKNSENNNYDASESHILKYSSSDNAMDISRYSLSKNVPFLNHPREHSINYRLFFDQKESQDVLDRFNTKRQFGKKINNKVFIDSGKCSAATSDSLNQPFKYYCTELAKSENDLHETSNENRIDNSIKSCRKNTPKQLWKKLKNIFLNRVHWKKMVTSNRCKTFCRSYSAPSLLRLDYSNVDCHRSNRFSTTIVELYNLLTDLCQESNDVVFHNKRSQLIQTTIKHSSDASSQCPEAMRSPRRPSRNINIEYPGLGKVKLPHQLRTSIYHFIENEAAFSNLQFLEKNIPIINRSSSANRIRGRVHEAKNDDRIDKRKRSRVPLRCSSESRYNYHKSIDSCNEMPIFCTLINDQSKLVIIEENKSVSFSDLRPIPRKWGLSKCNPLFTEIKFPNRTQIQTKIVEYDEDSSVRIGGLVADAISAIKLVSDAINNSQDLATICDKFVRCKDSNRQSTSVLLSAVDTVLTLISDGLSIDNGRSKKNLPATVTNTKIALRMWMFIEESCRSNLIKDASHKLAFTNLLKQVKSICGHTNTDQRSKEWLTQLKLQIFVVIAIKNNVFHIWLRAVVVNDTILHRFFAACSFLQQARTSYSNAFSAVIIEIRRLTTPENSQIRNISFAGKSRPLSNSSSDNSLSKSKIPRPNNKSANIAMKK